MAQFTVAAEKMHASASCHRRALSVRDRLGWDVGLHGRDRNSRRRRCGDVDGAVDDHERAADLHV